MKKTIIVMPVANEENTMGQILDEILALPYDNLYIYPVVDSYSKDRTEEIIREREKASDKVKCIFYQESTGVISCYLEGFRQALFSAPAGTVQAFTHNIGYDTVLIPMDKKNRQLTCFYPFYR